jgi:hypothetical protein
MTQRKSNLPEVYFKCPFFTVSSAAILPPIVQDSTTMVYESISFLTSLKHDLEQELVSPLKNSPNICFKNTHTYCVYIYSWASASRKLMPASALWYQ